MPRWRTLRGRVLRGLFRFFIQLPLFMEDAFLSIAAEVYSLGSWFIQQRYQGLIDMSNKYTEFWFLAGKSHLQIRDGCKVPCSVSSLRKASVQILIELLTFFVRCGIYMEGALFWIVDGIYFLGSSFFKQMYQLLVVIVHSDAEFLLFRCEINC
jgi:hypothetical protein